MKKYFFIIVLILFCIPSCKEDSVVPIPPSLQPKIKLALDDVSCTEAWLNLKLENITLPVDLELKKDSTAIKTFLAINSNDTTLYIDSLLPNQTYNFQLSGIGNPASGIKSNFIPATTLDTTSHNFTFETFEFGEPLTGYNSILYDVVIIDENNIWAVGEIYMNDSLGNPDHNAFNAVHWDGIQWQVKRINFPTVCGQTGYSSYPAKSVIIYNDSIIWISSSGDKIAILLDGEQINQFCLPSFLSMGINKMWKSSKNDLYVVGNSGNIAHYNGSQWTKIESRTTLPLIKVDGNSKGDVYASGGSYSTSESIVLKLNGIQPAEKIIDGYSDNQVDTSKLFISQLYGIFSGPWVDEGGSLIMGGSFIYRYRNNKWNFLNGVEGNYPGGFPSRGFIHDVSGISQNDFCIAGEFGTVQHHNGINAVQIGEPFSFQNTTMYYGVDMKGDIIVTVGKKIRKAVVTVYRR